MSGIFTILFMSIALGVAAFGIGMLPLFFTFTRAHVSYLSTVGTGLLIGAALGIIIPEGVETLISSGTSDPARKISLSLVLGFAFMLVVEQLIPGHDHSAHDELKHSPLPMSDTIHSRPRIADSGDTSVSNEDFDISLAELEDTEGPRARDGTTQPMLRRSDSPPAADRSRAFPMTLGLVIHSLADGLALGASAFPRKGDNGDESQSTQLSLVVFLAIIVHKAPTALALCMSLMSSLPPSECRKHLAAFSAATPLGTLAVYGFLHLLGGDLDGEWTGVALLLSGGTFLYVATVLAPVHKQETGSQSSQEINEKLRIGLILLGMFIPLLISFITGHNH